MLQIEPLPVLVKEELADAIARAGSNVGGTTKVSWPLVPVWTGGFLLVIFPARFTPPDGKSDRESLEHHAWPQGQRAAEGATLAVRAGGLRGGAAAFRRGFNRQPFWLLARCSCMLL